MPQVWAFQQNQATFVTYQRGTNQIEPMSGRWGICISVTLLWIQETLIHGDLPDATRINAGLHRATIHQAAMQMKYKIMANGGGAYNPAAELYDAYSLRPLATDNGGLYSLDTPVLEIQINGPGMYVLSIKRPGVGHALGFKIVDDNIGPSYYFDPGYGLVSFADQDAMLATMAQLNTPYHAYLGGTYWWRELTLA